jgi:hypothetical protein
MRRCEMRRLENKGFVRKVHEKNLDMPFNRFTTKTSTLPWGTTLNGYRVQFREELIGGFKVDITTADNKMVASGVKIRRWGWTDVKDPLTGNHMELSLSILYPHSLKMTVFEKKDF